MRRDLERFFKSKLEQLESPYRSSDWKAMEKMLEDENTKPVGFWFWLVPLLALGSLAFFLLPGESAEFYPEETKGQQAVESRQYQIDQLSSEEISQFSLMRSNTPTTHIDFSAYWPAEYRDAGFVPVTNRTSRWNKQPNISIALSELSDKRLEGVRLLQNDFNKLTTNVLNLKNKLDIIQFTQENPSRWRFGLGASISYDWNGHYQIWKDIAFYVHKHVSINARPGISFRNDFNPSSIRVVQNKFDFGKHSLVYDLDLGNQFSVDLPILVGIHNNRHSLFLGGGVEWTIGQRARFEVEEMSDLKNLSLGRNEGYLDQHFRNVWIESPRPFSSFAEAGYFYQLNKNINLGVRARLYFLDNSSFDELNERHYNAALLLKWNIIQ